MLAVSTENNRITDVKEIAQKDNHDLFSVYPNPFKYQTNVSFNITTSGSIVSLKVFDISGKYIETIFENSAYETGKHTIPWIASGYQSGLYIFCLSIDENTFSRKFLVE